MRKDREHFNIAAGQRIKAIAINERRSLSSISKMMDPPLSRANMSLKISGVNPFLDFEYQQIVNILNGNRIQKAEYVVEVILSGIYST